MTNTLTKFTVLAVDDEAGILSALKRQLRKSNFTLVTAGSGKEGLDILSQQEVQIVVSDMRMPEMSGAEFLAQVKKNHPRTVRILLTGYSDMESTVSAINEGGIFSYLSKPWESDELTTLLERASDYYQSQQTKQVDLVKATRRNQELRAVAENLEKKLDHSQKKVEQSSVFVAKAKREVSSAYDTAVEVFANLIDLKLPGESGLNREIAQLGQFIARQLDLSSKEQRNIRLAGMLYNVGKIGISTEITAKPYLELTEKEKTIFHRYPKMGENALIALTPLQSATQLIRLHRELPDGTGFPNGVAGEDLPLPARILSAVVAFRELATGRLTGEELSEPEAVAWMKQKTGAYDTDVLDVISRLVGQESEGNTNQGTQTVPAFALQDGMVLAEAIYAKDGILLLSEGHELNPMLISRLIGMENQLASAIVIQAE